MTDQTFGENWENSPNLPPNPPLNHPYPYPYWDPKESMNINGQDEGQRLGSLKGKKWVDNVMVKEQKTQGGAHMLVRFWSTNTSGCLSCTRNLWLGWLSAEDDYG